MRQNQELERKAVQDVARLMLTWSARLGAGSDVARRFSRTAERLLMGDRRGGRPQAP